MRLGAGRTRGALAEMVCCLLATPGWASGKVAQSPSASWTWQFVSSHLPRFQEKGKENRRLLIIEILFHNNQPNEQILTVAQEEFKATTKKGKPVEIRGLLFRMMQTEGAKSLIYKGGIKRMETLNDVQGDASILLIDSPGPVDVVVEGGKTYKQRLLLAKPKGKKPIRLQFGKLPDLEISLPK